MRPQHVVVGLTFAALALFGMLGLRHGAVLRAAPTAKHADPRARSGGRRTVPVVVELFTSEGCSSCPPADEVLARLERDQPVPGAEIVPLALHVDYWDDLGWPDPFASPSFTARQREYSSLGAGMYTPEAVVDGRVDVVGSRAASLERAIAEAATLPHTPIRISVRPSDGGADVSVSVGVASAGSMLRVALVQIEADVSVSRGENAGKRLHHTAIVRALVVAGTVPARGGEVHASLRAPRGIDRSALRVVAFAERVEDRRIVAAATSTFGG